jgi:hypothetical protein
MSEERVTEALNALREADSNIETGPEAEIRALLAFRRQQRSRRFRRVSAMSATAAAAAVLLTVSHWRTHETSVRMETVAPPPATSELIVAVTPTPPPHRAAAIAQEPEEIATDFYPLMVSAPPLERGLLVRVTVPAATMREVGLVIGDDHLSDPVQADILVGQDDLARAIRFVSYRNREN